MNSKPNIVFILADDMGYGDFARFNDGLTQTPTLDGLMDQGVTLTQQYTASCVCNPSRATLLTGRYPHRTGSIDTLEWRGLERLALRETTLADLLKTAGYRTGLIGKWHLGAYDPRYHPMRRGFDESVCFRGGMHDYWDWRIEFGEQAKRADGRYMTDVWTEESCAFIERHKNEPFFLHVTYNAPHTPLQCPEEDVKPFADTGKFNEELSTLYGMIKRMDTGIARILETLTRCGLDNNTLVIFTSDNGPQLGGKIDRFNCHYNGGKGSVLEGGIRVPMILRWPGVFDAGATCDAMVHFSDMLPTLLAAAGVDARPELPIDGVDVLPVLKGEGGSVCAHRYWQWNRYTPLVECNAAVRDGDWKLVRPEIPEAFELIGEAEWHRKSMYEYEYYLEHGVIEAPEPERDIPAPPELTLFNIAKDPLEQTNLAAQDPDRVHRMMRDLENWFEDVERDRASIEDEW